MFFFYQRIKILTEKVFGLENVENHNPIWSFVEEVRLTRARILTTECFCSVNFHSWLSWNTTNFMSRIWRICELKYARILPFRYGGLEYFIYVFFKGKTEFKLTHIQSVGRYPLRLETEEPNI